MANKVFNGIIRLRKDTEANFSKIENSFVPANGEACLIDGSYGIRVKIGDGTTTLANLPYIDKELYDEINSIVVRGHYFNNKFYTDSTYTVELLGIINHVYIDSNSNMLYTYDGNSYHSVLDTLPSASDVVAGITKLYNSTGSNEDGTMTQKSITDELNSKFEVEVDEDEETVIFSIGL